MELRDISKLVTDEQGWQHFGARFVGPDEWLPHVQGMDDRLSFGVVAQALASVADNEGVIPDFDVVKFYERDVTDVLRDEGDDPTWSVTYDRFTAMVLHDLRMEFAFRCLLARRHGGDYRLALPAEEPQSE